MELIKVTEQYQPAIALIQLNRPKELNALNPQLMGEVRDALQLLDKNDSVKVIIITGNEQAFAAGADIKQMADKSAIDMQIMDQFSTWDQIRKTKKPIIAAVSGFALGGGCEFVMTCDMVIASETAKFGQPEIKIGTIPGAGGTQRLTKAVGKAKAMELILTGRFLSAQEAHFYGLVNKVVPVEMYMHEAVELANEIAQMSPVAVLLAKEAINRSFETQLDEGLMFERKNFYLTFASEDQKEGMKAFIEKRKPAFKGK
ncbi:MAG TPA: enoyl-CoA hydratase-related protein [Cyclobacteriaceae bacterium]|nr:enoyl-CoA hydratase/isomerase family protein [Cyclobacteriaceae bacterium]HMV09047.1 enoyl-CoA hydratase-related protein [Cyclobacteriaceae bacterium]HMV89891.1 enoyl-CoA hydratase-related protein [Cyclobacteriaceae bacterium]HMW99548.1 enoyl-CoA hydratase-related protein [Cyclobacteriaceae bacterium]HMX51669.1 enoyl-CoA hydratase-related protein [Cyclobacteriaceae bacterium]